MPLAIIFVLVLGFIFWGLKQELNDDIETIKRRNAEHDKRRAERDKQKSPPPGKEVR